MEKTKTDGEYRESHHMFPVSIFGKNDKTVNFTPREHYIAHWLLYKICEKRYGEKHKNTFKMASALMMMMNESCLTRRKMPSRFYEISRKIWRKNWINPMKNPKNRMYGKDNPMYKIGKNHPLYGKKMSEETKEKISRANKGKLKGDKNPAKREDVKLKISKNRKGKHKLRRDENPNSKLTENDVNHLLSLWEKEREDGVSGYAFCKKYNTEYDVSPSTIGNLIFKKK